MNALLIAAHGSRVASSVQEIEALTHGIRSRVSGVFDRVECAFLQWAEPSIPAKVEELVAGGVTEVVLMPYLLSMGSHVAQDIPSVVTDLEAAHSALHIRVLPHIGAAAGMVDLLCDHAGSWPCHPWVTPDNSRPGA